MRELRLDALRWTRQRLALRNLYDKQALEHPLWILRSTLLHAIPRSEDGDKFQFILRPTEGLPEAIEKSRVYELDVYFAGDAAETATTFVSQLGEHLADRSHHFRLEHAGPPEVRTFEKALGQAKSWPDGADEICLDFFTPCAYTPAAPRRPWLLSAVRLGELFDLRLQNFFGLEVAPTGDLWAKVRTVCCYWSYVEFVHGPKDSDETQNLTGNVGPLYLQGGPDELAALRPWLILGEELGCGRRLGARGHYRLEFGRPWFDPRWGRPETYLAALEELHRRADLPETFGRQLGDPTAASAWLASTVASGQWQPVPATGFRAAKTASSEDRLLVQLPARDRLLHQAFQIALTPVFDRLFEPQSHAFRPGRGVESARRFVQEAWQHGYTYALAADVEDFFDMVDWDVLETHLDAALPRADVHTRATLHALLRTPVRLGRRPVSRTRGLLQGSPLSPLLANLYLDHFDEEMTRCGFCLVRYADDFIVLCRSEAEANQAVAAAGEILGTLRLGLNKEKTAIADFARGFTFLGQQFGGGFEQEMVEDTALQKTLFIRHPHAWVGIDHDSLVVRDEGKLLARIPFRRIREVLLLGTAGVSTRLIERCAQRGISLAFCTAAGRHLNTVWRADHEQYSLVAAHARRHASMPEAERLACARALVAAKIKNYVVWLRERTKPETRPIVESLDAALELLAGTDTLDKIRGVEGLAAREVFGLLSRSNPEFFHSAARRPHEAPDPWNLLLDFAYSMLFQRLNSLLRARGLNPFLGILHSPDARYESLVCDLQEPFRARCDRFVVNLVHRSQIQEADFTKSPVTGWELQNPAAARFLELFEQELDTRKGGDLAAWGRLIEAQVLVVERWVKDGQPFKVFHARAPSAPSESAKIRAGSDGRTRSAETE